MRLIWLTTMLAGSVAVAWPASASPMVEESRVAVAPGVTLRSIEVGRANVKAPLVFIPGWSAGADIWTGQIERFGAARRVIAFDPRSQGESTKTTSGNTPEQRAADLHALLAAKHIAKPVLVGWSQGAQDVAAYVARYGTHELTGIVLVDAAVSDGAQGIATRPAETAKQFELFAIYTKDQEAYLHAMFGAIVSKPQPAGAIDGLVATAMKTPPSTGIAMLVADMFAIDRTVGLTSIDCPALIIAAASSGELARQQAEARLIKGAQLVKIEDAAHAVFLDQPDRFESALRNFLDHAETSPGR